MDHEQRKLFAVLSLIAIITLGGIIVFFSDNDDSVTGFAIVRDGYRDCLNAEEEKCINQALPPAEFGDCLELVPDICK